MAWWDQRYNALTGQGSTTPTNTGGTNTPVKTNNEWWANRYNTLQADEQWRVQNAPVTPVQVQPAQPAQPVQPVQPKKSLLQKVGEGVKNFFNSDVPEPDTTPIQTHSTTQPAQKSFIDFLFAETPDKYKSKNILENLNPLKSLKRGVSAAQETLAKPEYTQVRSGMAMVQGQLSIDKQIENIQNALQKSADKDVASDYSLENTMKSLEPKKGFVSPAELESYRTNIFKEVINHPATYMAEAQKYIEPIITGNQFTGKMSKSVTDFFLGIAGGSKKADAMWQEKLKEPVTTEDKVLSTAGDVAGTVLSLIGGGAILKGFGLAKVSAPLLYEVMGQESLPKDTALEDRFKKAPLYLVAGWLTSKVGLPKKFLSMETLTGATKTGAILSGQAYIDYLTRGYSPKETADIALRMALVGVLYHIGFSAASVAIRPKTGSVSNVEFTPSELRSRVVGSPYQDTEFGKYLIKLSIEAESSGKNISMSAQALGKSPLAKTLGTKAPNGLNVDAKLVDPNPQLKTTTNTAKDTKTAQPEARQALSTEGSKVPEKPQTSTQIMEKAGWVGGDKSKSVFDLALYKKDAVTIKQMLPDVPQYYKEKFATEIAKITGESPIAPATTAPPATLSVKPTAPATVPVTPTRESVLKLPLVFIKNADKYVRVEDFADNIEGSNPQDQVGTLDPKTITARDPLERAKVDKMVEDIKSGNAEEMPPIIIERTDAGGLQTFEGSHRVTAYLEAGVPVPVIYHGKDPIPGLIKIEDLYKLLNEKTATQKGIQPQEVKKPATERIVEPKPQQEPSNKGKEVQHLERVKKDSEQTIINLEKQLNSMAKNAPGRKYLQDRIKAEKSYIEIYNRDLSKLGFGEIAKPKTRISAKSKQKEMEKIEKQARQEASPFNNPDINQYSEIINKAVRVYNLTKSKGREDVSTITKKVPGLDEALGALGDAGYNVETIDDLIALKKKGSGGYADMGGYSDVKSAEKTVENLKGVEFPELLRMAKDLMGSVPKLKRFPRALGMFYPKGEGFIKLSPEIFKDPKLAVRVFAHELGHLADYLPDKAMDRGNILGRIAVLKRYRKFFLPEDTNKDFGRNDIVKELKKLSQLWKPFNEKVNPGYTKYRYSSKELYADAISVLFNDPALLKKEAPKFYEAFFEYLDNKPQLAKAFSDLQDLLNNGSDTVMARRNEEMNKMFKSGEQKYVSKELEKQKRKTSLLFDLQILLDDKNQAVINQLKKVKKSGKTVEDAANPVYALEELNYLDASIRNWIEKTYQPVFKKAQQVDGGWDELGKIVFYERVINERGELANPAGYDPKTAQDQLNYLERTTDPKDWLILQDAKRDFRNATQELNNKAEKEGFYTPEMLAQMKANPAYATFQVVDYLDTYISPAIYKSVGTLKDVANPATSTVMKTISILKAIERNNAKKVLMDFQLEYFKEDTLPAKTKFNGKFKEVVESKDPDKELVTVIRNGELSGYYVDPYIARTVKYMGNDTVSKMAKVVRTISGASFYRPIFTGVNLGFQTFNFVRDFERYWKSIPDENVGQAITSFFKTFKYYGKAIKPAWARVTDHKSEIIKNMEDMKILGLTYNDLGKSYDPEDAQIERTLSKIGISSGKEPKKFIVLKAISKVIDGAEVLGNFIETLPKAAGYQQLRNSMPEKELASFLRTKAGSPDFRRSGTATPITNSVFLFSNAIKEGMKADFQTATDPKTRSGYWWKTFLINILPKILMLVAAGGYLGKKTKDIMDNASEYDKTNYIIIPLDLDKNGKGIYIRKPQDETGRLIGGMFWKAANIVGKKEVRLQDLADIFSFNAGQLPTLTPSFEGIGATIAYLSGLNPYDSFRGRLVIPETEFKAGYKYSFPIFMNWLIQNQGLGIVFPSYTPQDAEMTTLQKVLSLPVLSNILGRWVKVSDYGKTETYRKITNEVTAEKAAQTVEENTKIQEAYDAYKKTDKSDASYKSAVTALVENITGQKFDKLDKDAVTKGNAVIKKFNVAIIRGRADPQINALISAPTNDAKAELLKPILKSMTAKDAQSFLKQMVDEKIITADVLEKYAKLKGRNE